jgi:hypothetical protein
VVHDYNPSTREEHEFETSIGYTARGGEKNGERRGERDRESKRRWMKGEREREERRKQASVARAE